jgi:hypothetical protein
MSSEILSVLEYMEKEKGIGRADMIAAIVNAIKTAALRGVNSGQEMKIEIDPKNGQLRAWAQMKVVDSVSDPKLEIHIEKAQLLKPGAQLGDLLEKEIDPSFLGRIAAQTARQAIMQKLRQFEKDRIYDDFKDMVGNIVTGTVRRRERNDIYVDLGKAEALLMGKEQVPGEEYQPGDRIRGDRDRRRHREDRCLCPRAGLPHQDGRHVERPKGRSGGRVRGCSRSAGKDSCARAERREDRYHQLFRRSRGDGARGAQARRAARRGARRKSPSNPVASS